MSVTTMVSPDERSEAGCAPAPTLHIGPDTETWGDLIERRRPDRARATRFREQLGLPAESRLIMTGHQAEFWHAGVLAKFLAADIAAERLGADVAWTLVDQDEHAFTEIEYPAIDTGAAERRRMPITQTPMPAGAAVASCPAFTPVDAAPEDAPPFVVNGIRRILEELQSAGRQATSASGQISRALTRLMAPLVSERRWVSATSLHHTDLFRELIEDMRAEPRVAIESYNNAVLARPDAGVGPLRAGSNEDDIELPLWRLHPGAPRRRVSVGELDSIPLQQLAPRALLLTALMRLAGCDLFIHGTGGAAYDRITEDWIERWLGEPLAPQAAVSADLALPLPGADVEPEALAEARWRLHHARHDPSAQPGATLSDAKRSLIEDVERAKRAGEDAGPQFDALHRWLDEQRRAHAARLRRLEHEAQRIERTLASRDVARDRSWAFPLHPPESLRALRSRLSEALRV